MGLNFTGEQIVPELMAFDTRELQAHLSRYVWALQWCTDKVVLDAACGVGYGSMMLSWAAKKVLGVDRSYECVRYANDTYKTARNEFSIADLEKLQWQTPEFDVIVSFETIEHLQEPEEFLGAAYRILKPGGVLIVSAPENSGSTWHVRDYTANDLCNLIARSPFRSRELPWRYFCQGPRGTPIEDGEPEWEHPTHILVVGKGE